MLDERAVVELANHTALVAKDGSEVPIEDTAAPIRSGDEAISGVVLVFRDVTGQRRAVEASLRLAAIVESSDDAIVGESLDGCITAWNKGAERLYGYAADEVVGRPLSVLVPPDHPDELTALMERIRRGESIDHYETVRVRKDGSRVDVSLSISPVRDADGEVVGAAKIARDITERRRAEESLRRQNERLRLLWEAAAVLLHADDPDAMLRSVFAKISPHLGLDTYFNFMVDEAGNALRLASCAGIPDDEARKIARLEFGQAICGTVNPSQSKRPRSTPLRCGTKLFAGIRDGSGVPMTPPRWAGDIGAGTLRSSARTA